MRVRTTGSGLSKSQLRGRGMVTVQGMEEIKRKFRKVRVELRKKVSARAVRRAGKVFKLHAESYAPVDEGVLQQHIRISVRALRSDPSVMAAMIGVIKETFYGRFVEFGVKGRPGKPWLRPAFDNGAAAAEKEIAKTYKNYFRRHKIQ